MSLNYIERPSWDVNSEAVVIKTAQEKVRWVKEKENLAEIKTVASSVVIYRHSKKNENHVVEMVELPAKLIKDLYNAFMEIESRPHTEDFWD